MPTHEGLPVAGYKPQTEIKVDLVNANKVTEEHLLRTIESLAGGIGDPRCLALAKTYLETGFMWLNRAIFQPGRAPLPGDPK